MPGQYEVRNTESSDLPLIFEFFAHSIDYQEKKGYPVWRNYDRNTVRTELENKNQYKIMIDSEPAIVFSIRYADKAIWRDLDRGDAIYLHRIVVNPAFKGRRLFGAVLDWSVEHARQKNLGIIRMDTWADNAVIIEYYKSFGFSFIKNITTSNSEELPVHNRNLIMALLEYKIKN